MAKTLIQLALGLLVIAVVVAFFAMNYQLP